MDANAFLLGLKEALPEQWPPSVGPWTAYITDKLHEVAAASGMGCCCTNGHRDAGSWAESTKAAGLRREYQFDYTWYRSWLAYEQPAVIIEHENQKPVAEFLLDFWKLMFGYAPLRVMIGYQTDEARAKDILATITKTAATANWRYPAGVDDLVLVGTDMMTPRQFHVFHRREGGRDFEDRGLLSALFEDA